MKCTIWTTALITAAAFVLPGTANAQSFGTNLIVNGDAEAAAGGGGEVVPVPGFTRTGEFTTIRYDAGGGYPVPSDPGAADGGRNFFNGGYVEQSTGMQTIDISSLASFVDGGATSYTLSALLGGFSSQGDFATLGINFLGASNLTLGTASIGPVTPEDRNFITGFQTRTTTGFVPVGTRAIDVLLGFTRTNGSANDGYADNLSLKLAAGPLVASVPEPATWTMMILGFGAVGFALRRRHVRTTVAFA